MIKMPIFLSLLLIATAVPTASAEYFPGLEDVRDMSYCALGGPIHERCTQGCDPRLVDATWCSVQFTYWLVGHFIIEQ